MIDGKPNYTRLSTIAMADVVLMDQDGRIQFVNALCEMFENLANPDYIPEEKPGFVGRAIMRQFAEFREGAKKYMDNVNRNPSGTSNKGDTPPGNPPPTPPGDPMGKTTETPKELELEKEIEIEEELEIESEKNIGTSAPAEEQKPHKTRTRFTPPTVEEVAIYCKERNNSIDPQQFVDYYTSNGWKVGKNPMKDWKAAVRMWERNQGKGGRSSSVQNRVPGQRDDYQF